MKKLNICIIDEPLNLNILSELFPFLPAISMKNHREDSMVPFVSHGSYCAAILIEALTSYGIIDRVTITHYSIADRNEPMSIAQFTQALKYCSEVRPHIISLSLGMTGRRYLKNIVPFLLNIRDSAILAAASNDMKITYPAAFPQVIGVKRNVDVSKPQYLYVKTPIDGIELLANMPQTDILKRFESEYKYSSGVTNSSLVPRVCADLCNKMISAKIKRIHSKSSVYQILGAKKADRIEGQRFSSPLMMPDFYEKTPIILVKADQTDPKNISKALALQKKFECLDYSCAIISEAFAENNFLEGHYTTRSPFSVKYISLLQSIISDSLILLLAESIDATCAVIDYYISDWERRDVSDLCREILGSFSDEA